MTTQKIAKVSAWLVGILALLSFVLSYSALRDVAMSNGVTGAYGILSLIWPLIIDGALVVFALAVVRASLSKDGQIWLWGLVLLFTGATIYFNVTHASDTTLTARLVALMPPVALFLSFETLMSMVRNDVNRQSVTRSIAELSQERDAQRQEWETERQTVTAEIERMSKQRDKLQVELSQLREDVSQEKMTPVQLRRQQLPELVTDGVPVADIAERFSVTPKTIYRDLDILGLSPPTVNGNGAVK